MEIIIQSMLLLVIAVFAKCAEITDYSHQWSIAFPCDGNKKISLVYLRDTLENKKFEYIVKIRGPIPKSNQIVIKLNIPSIINMTDAAKEVYVAREEVIHVRQIENERNFGIKMKSRWGKLPEVTSVLIDDVEHCHRELENQFTESAGLIGSHILIEGSEKERNQTNTMVPVPIKYPCGLRKIDYTDLAVFGTDTKRGEWPWHAAIFKVDSSFVNYICGGTLISDSIVLTAAHCVTVKGAALIPKFLLVVLGSNKFFGSDYDNASQNKRVYDVTIHDKYNYADTKNDIAVLRLETAAVYNNYVQPACLWQPQNLQGQPIYGIIVGWKINENGQVSMNLRQETLPRVSDKSCATSYPNIVNNFTSNTVFCAGWVNGTSATCNGFGGGGFYVFVPDNPKDVSLNVPGKWHVHGITSVGVSTNKIRCDSEKYGIFTDVGKFYSWINEHL